MQAIEWSKRFSVGVEMLDSQHKVLVELVNTMLSKTDPGTMFDGIMGMFNYASEHFAAEENLLRASGYPELDRQIIEHKAFLAKTTEFSARDLSKLANCTEVTTYLREWLMHHILEEDMKYKNRL